MNDIYDKKCLGNLADINKFMKPFIAKTSIFIFLILLPCSMYSQSIKKSRQTATSEYSKSNIKIGRFTAIPDEIYGGSCCFYSSIQEKKKGIYVCVNDMASVAYLVINDKMERFILVNTEKNRIFNYKNNHYSLEIVVLKNKKTGYESYATEGKMIVSTLDGQKKGFTFIGDCGL